MQEARSKFQADVSLSHSTSDSFFAITTCIGWYTGSPTMPNATANAAIAALWLAGCAHPCASLRPRAGSYATGGSAGYATGAETGDLGGVDPGLQ